MYVVFYIYISIVIFILYFSSSGPSKDVKISRFYFMSICVAYAFLWPLLVCLIFLVYNSRTYK
jgi:hypothetical protein